MKEQIKKYKKWQKRKQRIQQLMECRLEELWYTSTVEWFDQHSKDLDKSDYWCEAINFKDNDFCVTWCRHTNSYDDEKEYAYTPNLPYSFFDDPLEHIKVLKEEREKQLQKKLQEKADKQKQYDLEQLAKLKALYETPHSSMGN
jgi:hypothetical protein